MRKRIFRSRCASHRRQSGADSDFSWVEFSRSVKGRQREKNSESQSWVAGWEPVGVLMTSRTSRRRKPGLHTVRSRNLAVSRLVTSAATSPRFVPRNCGAQPCSPLTLDKGSHEGTILSILLFYQAVKSDRPGDGIGDNVI
jgi:hypothetical protein